MQDRLSTYPGRIRLIPVQGQDNVFDVERADEPSQMGTELKKDTLLSDAVAALLGMDGSSGTPSAAFGKLKSMLDSAVGQIGPKKLGSYKGTGAHGSGNKNKLTFDFQPKVLFIEGHAIPRGTGDVPVQSGHVYFTWSGNTVSWYSPQGATQQWNFSGTTYYYAALGWDESDKTAEPWPNVSIIDGVFTVS